MKTGCLNWNEFTATVATRPRAWRAASTLPAVSTCDMIQPPKISPCWLASAGIGTTRRTGSLPSGSDIFLWSFIAGRLADFLRSRKRRGILDAERARRVARLVDAPHLEVGALEIPDITRDVEQRMRIAIASQALLQFPEFARVRGKVDRKPLVFRHVFRDQLIQPEPVQETRAQARNEVFSRESDEGNSAPQSVGAGRKRAAPDRFQRRRRAVGDLLLPHPAAATARYPARSEGCASTIGMLLDRFSRADETRKKRTCRRAGSLRCGQASARSESSGAKRAGRNEAAERSFRQRRIRPMRARPWRHR